MFKRPYRKRIYRKKVCILFVQIVNRNLGDQVIADNTEYLVRQALPRLARQHYVLQHYDIQSEDYELARQADLMLFDGGGIIKYRQEEFYRHVPELLALAQECGIPVYFNSVGVEGYDAGDARCIRLAQALRYDCVKGISVRDDLETLRRDYLKDSAAGTMAVDPAVFTPQAYGIQKDAQSQVIGLGIVRYRIFEDYGIPQVTREFQLELWQGIAKELERRGYAWQLFVNGLRSDYDFALEVLRYMGREGEADTLLAPRPVQSSELVQTIAGYQGVIACRMHANIIAYALGIVSVGLVWNDKMVFWGERIGCPERFLTSGQFTPDQIVQCLTDSLAQGVQPCPAALKNSVQKPLKKFIRRYGRAAWKKNRAQHLKKPAGWSGRLVAAALGGISMRYTNMNTPQGLAGALEGGFQIFEADLRLTVQDTALAQDMPMQQKLVCVNGWSKGTLEKLGADPQRYQKGMDYETFMKCRMYGSYETMDAAQLFARMRGMEGDWKLILDIGKPNKEALAQIIGQLQALCEAGADWKEHLLLRLQSKYDVETVQEAGLLVQVMYYVPPKQVRQEKNITLDAIGKFCKKRGIAWVSMPKEALDEEVMAYLKKQKLKSCLFTYNRYTDVLRALELGVDWVATSYLSVKELESWYEAGYTIVIR
ncbi:MAG: polysaccharide pyruvyl transferase family protein [Eubacterium sp.]|nr:polysaccharide pyruvyl transferase family protein [Eubacterium sp.]